MSQAGHKQLVPNVMASWLAYAAATVIGFVMPRLVLDSVGQEMLGIWDLCWSFLAYITFAGIGMGTAVGHQTAQIKEGQEPRQMPRIFATGFYMQLPLAIGLAALFGLVLIIIPMLFTNFTTVDSQLLLELSRLIALTVIILLLGEIAQGVLIGNHQSRITEYINVAHDVTLAVSMVLALIAGLGILGLAWVTFMVRAVTEVVRIGVVAYSVRGISIAPSAVDRETARSMGLFATKSSIFGLQELLVYQVIRVAFFISAGPAAFAAFSRYSTLARQINRLTDRLTLSIPALTTGITASGGDFLQIREVYAYGVRGVLMVTLPTLAVFATFGDPIVAIWMGRDFVIPGIAWTFAAACVLHAHYVMSAKVLRGIDSHGKISLYCMCASAVMLVLLYWIAPPADAGTAAWHIAAVMLVTVHIPHILFASQKIDFAFLRQVRDIYAKPLLYNILFVGILLFSRYLVDTGNIFLATFTMLTSMAGLALAYWYSVCDVRMRNKLRDSFQRAVVGKV